MAEVKKTEKGKKASSFREMLSDRVPVFLFKDNDRYKDDVLVGVNGHPFRIKRGVTVLVPRFVAAALENSQAQDTKTANLIEQESNAYQNMAKLLE